MVELKEAMPLEASLLVHLKVFVDLKHQLTNCNMSVRYTCHDVSMSTCDL